jgi:predicted MFS family arabinose efflux permease
LGGSRAGGAAGAASGGGGGGATAIVFAGNSLAVVVGTPMVSALGTSLGWRPAEAVIAVAGVGATVAVATLVPLGAGAAFGAGASGGGAAGAETRAGAKAGAGTGTGAGTRTGASAGAGGAAPRPVSTSASALGSISAAVRNGPLLAVCAVTAMVVLGHYSVYTYITRLIGHSTGLTGLAVAAVLFAYGAAGVVGNATAGATIDRWPRRTALATVAIIVISLATIGVTGQASTVATIIAMIAWGAAFTAFPACLQAGVLRVAPDHPETASALYVVAFQIGIGGGALLGSILVDGGHLATLPFFGAIVAAGGLVILAAFPRAVPKQDQQTPVAAPRSDHATPSRPAQKGSGSAIHAGTKSCQSSPCGHKLR